MNHTTNNSPVTGSVMRACLWLAVLSSGGCAAFHPIAGVPARYLAPELRAESRANESTIDLSLLAQTPPRQHYVDAGDVLGIYIEGVLGRAGESPPITVPTSPDLPPSIGYPITVRDDGTLSLPLIGSVDVRGLTIRQVEEKLRHLYTINKNYLKVGQDRIIVSLQRPRQVRVLVLRQESGGPGGTEFAQGLSLNLGQTKRGSGQTVNLPIYKNDVLHALARTGGLPGLDAENTIYVIRGQNGGGPGAMMHGGPRDLGHQFAPHQFAPDMSGQFSPSQHPALPQMQPPQFQQPQLQQPQIQQHIPRPQEHRPMPTPARTHPVHPASSRYGGLPQGAERPVIRGQSPSGPMYSSGFTIQPTQVQNFQRTDPLQELRAGMGSGGQRAMLREPRESQSLEMLPRPKHLAAFSANPVNSSATPVSTVSQQRPVRALPVQTQTMLPPLQAPQFQSEQLQRPQLPLQQPPMSPAPTVEMRPYPDPVMQAPQPHTMLGGPAGGNHLIPTEPAPPLTHSQLPAGLDLLQLQASGFCDLADPTMNNPQVIQIPVRLKPGQQPHIRPEDVILHDGDIVFIESRETEIFYTGGLLGGGQFTLPRDYDLDVLGAIAIAQGSSQQQQAGRQIGGVSAINGDVTISASDVIILRQTCNGSQVPIKVDLYRAIRDPAERVIIQPGDIVMLRYKPLEAFGAFVERNLLESALLGFAAAQLQSGGGGGN